MANGIVLAPGTGAATSGDITVKNVPIMVKAYGGALGSDTGALEVQAPDQTWDAVYDAGSAVELSATNPQFMIMGSGTYRVDWAGRTNSIGVVASDSPARS